MPTPTIAPAHTPGASDAPGSVRDSSSGPRDFSSSGPGLEHEAFHGFPYSLIVFDRDGRFVATNLEGRRLIAAMELTDDGSEDEGRGEDEGRNEDGNMGKVEVEGESEGDEDRLTCCRLLGCRAAEGVLADACLTELAQARGHALPEVRVDLTTTEGVRAMWVTAAPLLDSAELRVILQLRPGATQDRRRRTDPHWMTGPRLRIRALGRTLVESPEGPIGGDWLDQRTGQLLKYLIAERNRPVHIDEIGESIWPGADFAIAGSVRYYIHALRGRLEPQRGPREPSRFIASNSGSYRLNLTHIELDADEFESRLNAGLAAVEHDPEPAATELERGLSLYRGDFLADSPYADWAMLERHRLRDLACTGLRGLAGIRLQARLIDGAARALEQLASLQPYDESVHRQLMELDIMRGRRTDAVRRYDSLRTRIKRTFGHEPDFTPADLDRPTPI